MTRTLYKAFSAFLDGAAQGKHFLAGIVLLSLMVSVTYGVVMRYVL
jgi:TRAP-type C4-dicarboxylate transport system permease small subunit